MLLTLLIPEYLLSKAFSDLISARRCLSDYRHIAEIDDVEWSIAHTCLANMGGFIIRFQDDIDHCKSRGSLHHGDEDENAVEPSKDITVADEKDQNNDEAQMTSDKTAGLSSQTWQTRLADANSTQANVPVFRQANDGMTSKQDASLRVLSSAASSTTEEPQLAISFTRSACEVNEVASLSPVLSNRSRTFQSTDNEPANDKSSVNRVEESQSGSTQEDLEYGLTKQQRYFARAKSRLIQLSLTPNHGLQAYVSGERADESAIGPTSWSQDSKNTDVARSALHELELEHFTTDWERDRFLNDHRHWYSNLVVLQGNIWVLDASQFLLARRLGIINRLPSVTMDELNDRNKGDLLVKGIALCQILWSLVHVSVRVAEHDRAPSQLEIVVLSFSICTSLTYALLCSKPQDVATPTYVNAYRRPTVEEMIRLSANGPLTYWNFRFRYWISNNVTHNDGSGPRVPRQRMALGIVAAALVFGIVHCLAWNLHFPTSVERLLWRVAAVLTALTPFFGYITALTIRWSSSDFSPGLMRHRRASENFRGLIMYTVWVLYILARVYTALEALRGLMFLAPETFLETWTINFPHIG